MSTNILIFCGSAKSIKKSEIVNSIKEERIFLVARITASSTSPGSSSEAWSKITVTYKQDKRPIVFVHYRQGEDLAQIVSDTLEDVGDSAGRASEQVVEALRQTNQLIVIELDAAYLGDDAWKAIDSIEAFLAFAFQGIIYVPDEGFYDEGTT